MWEIRREREDDASAVEALVDQGFGPGRWAKTAYRLREGVEPDARLSFVAESTKGRALLGSVRFWPISAGGRPVLLLGPLAVKTDLRGKGIGIGLMQRGIDESRALNYDAIILVGDEPYYARVGFTKIAPGKVRFPGPVNSARILGLSLKANALVSLSGDIKRARIDSPISAQSAPLA